VTRRRIRREVVSYDTWPDALHPAAPGNCRSPMRCGVCSRCTTMRMAIATSRGPGPEPTTARGHGRSAKHAIGSIGRSRRSSPAARSGSRARSGRVRSAITGTSPSATSGARRCRARSSVSGVAVIAGPRPRVSGCGWSRPGDWNTGRRAARPRSSSRGSARRGSAICTSGSNDSRPISKPAAGSIPGDGCRCRPSRPRRSS